MVFEKTMPEFWRIGEKRLYLRAILEYMKLYKTLIFIFALLALLGCTAYFFPKEGISLGPVDVEFPTLTDALKINSLFDGNEEEEEVPLSPEEQLELEMEQLKAAQDSTFVDFCENSPIRIAMPLVIKDTLDSLAVPEEDLTYLDDFFESLDSACVHHMRILHYGDSQIEEDRITSGLREHFQAQFGGGGSGMLPAQQWINRLTNSQSTSPKLTNYMAFGSRDFRNSNRHYGPMAAFSNCYGPTHITVTMTSNERYAHVRNFNKISIMRNDPETGRLKFIVQEFDSMQHKANITVDGPAELYGIMLDQKTGVSMDNVPMRGSSGNVFTTIAPETFVPFFEHENVRLIILQYGGNMVPSLGSEESMQRICNGLVKQVDYFHKIAPKAKILFIGPSDMSTRVQGTMQTYPKLPTFIEMLEKTMVNCGVAFWNMYEAMGGKGSMVRWVAARPQLAGEDYVHFTHKGAEHVSDLLFETIDTYYKYYKFRRGELELKLPNEEEDSLAVDSVDVPELTESVSD